MTAALDAGRTRLRPVIMTALAMIVGMLPMSLGLGDGGEQNAPLARSVIGGLLVPVVYSYPAGGSRGASGPYREYPALDRQFDFRLQTGGLKKQFGNTDALRIPNADNAGFHGKSLQRSQAFALNRIAE